MTDNNVEDHEKRKKALKVLQSWIENLEEEYSKCQETIGSKHGG